jgi:hypothetical protein
MQVSGSDVLERLATTDNCLYVQFMSDAPTYLKPLLDLFAGPLADVRFADLDAQTLAKAAAEVETGEEELTAAQAALDAVRARLHERQEALLQVAHRALAYARVYAEQDEALAASVAAIALPRPVRRVRAGGEALVLSPDPAPMSSDGTRPRGRPRKVSPREIGPDTLAPMVE